MYRTSTSGRAQTRERHLVSANVMSCRSLGVLGVSEPAAPAAFGVDDLGALVMVRRQLDDVSRPGFVGDIGDVNIGDVVGELEAIDANALIIRRRDDSMVQVPWTSVLAAKRVGVSPLAARLLEGVSARGWVGSDGEWLGQWWLRAANGFTARANSVRPLGSPGVPLDEALAFVANWYAERDLPAQIRVIVGSRLDDELARRGWPAASETRVQTVPLRQALARLSGAAGDAVEVPHPIALTEVPSAAWLRAFRGGKNGPAAVPVLMSGTRPTFAEISAPDVGTAPDAPTIAIGRATVEDAWVGISVIEVAERYRRQGFARAVMRSLLTWARMLDVRQVYLEVLANNEAALALYESLAFTTHHSYQYRTPPSL